MLITQFDQTLKGCPYCGCISTIHECLCTKDVLKVTCKECKHSYFITPTLKLNDSTYINGIGTVTVESNNRQHNGHYYVKKDERPNIGEFVTIVDSNTERCHLQFKSAEALDRMFTILSCMQPKDLSSTISDIDNHILTLSDKDVDIAGLITHIASTGILTASVIEHTLRL